MNMESKPVTGIATSDDDIAITIHDMENNINLISNLFGKIALKKINVDMISLTAPIDNKVNISFTIPMDDLNECKKIIRELAEGKDYFIDEDITKFSIVGIGMKTTSGVAGKMFQAFAENNIAMKMVTTSEIRITSAISKKDKIKALDAVIKTFDL